MEKYSLEKIIDDAWKSCIIENKEKEYVAEENVAVLVASFETCKRIDPNICSSEAVEMGGFKGGIIIIKEQVFDYDSLKFVTMHEMGHIIHGHELVSSIEDDLEHEKAADFYAMKRGSFTISQAQDIVEKLFESYIKLAKQVGKEEEELLKETLRIRLQNINEFKS